MSYIIYGYVFYHNHNHKLAKSLQLRSFGCSLHKSIQTLVIRVLFTITHYYMFTTLVKRLQQAAECGDSVVLSSLLQPHGKQRL